MPESKKTGLQFVFGENLKKGGNLTSTPQVSFDDLGDFVEERKKIQRLIERRGESSLRVDYSDFSNHVFFDSAVSKFSIAQDKILTKYPFNGSSEEKDAFFLSASDYEGYVFDHWPGYVGYLSFDGNQYISASDNDNDLLFSTGSFIVSAWIDPAEIQGEDLVFQKTGKLSNLFEYSQDFDNSYWTKNNTSVSSSISAPLSSSMSATAIYEDGTLNSNFYLVSDSVSLESGSFYRFSVFAKAGNRSWLRLQDSLAVPALTASTSFSLTSNSMTTPGSPNIRTSSSIDVGDGWRYLSIGWEQPVSSTRQMYLLVEEGSFDATFDGQDWLSCYIFGAQLEKDPFPFEDSQRYLETSGSLKDFKNGVEFYLSGSSDPCLNFAVFSGSQKTIVSSSYGEYTGSFSSVAGVYDSNNSLLSLYVDGDLQSSSSISYGSIEFSAGKVFIGSGSRGFPDAVSGTFNYYSGSINEVRVLHTGSGFLYQKNYSRPIDSEDYTALYYNFNEGITGLDSVDQVVVDYSKSGIHGKIINYSTNSRVSGSVLREDPGQPILYSFHPSVVSHSGSQLLSASLYDNNNNNSIFNIISSDLLIEDEESGDGLLTSFVLALARYFDEIKLYIDQFDNLKVTNYQKVNETPDLFLPLLKRYFGWKVSEHYSEAAPLEFLYGESILSSGSIDSSLAGIRDQFWRRTLNNLPYLIKTKGKRHSLDAYFNVLGLNKENINLKEYGYLPGGSIQDDRVVKNKPVSLVGIGTGSFSGSYFKVPSLGTFYSGSDLTVELHTQLPYVSASFSSSLLTGSLWQFVSTGTGDSFRFYWVRDSLESESGKLVMESSGSGVFSSSDLDIFNGEVTYIAAGINGEAASQFIEARQVDSGEFTLSGTFSGGVDFSVPSQSYDFIMGANSGSFFEPDASSEGYFGEFRVWNRELSGTEISDHSLNFQSVGLIDPLVEPNPLVGHWSLSQDLTSDTSGEISPIVDLSRNENTATGFEFQPSHRPSKKFLLNYNLLSPSVDLKWTDNKVRVRNKTELTIDDVANDTNEVALEFNFVDSLNEDISKIFATIEEVNNLIGQPVFKYRDEYSDLEGVRRKYFERLSEKLNFSRFFNLFKWFDKKLSDSIKQMLPARVNFIGGEQIVESHFLERPRYGYKYPVFRTPQTPPEAEINLLPRTSGSVYNQYDISSFKADQFRDTRKFDTAVLTDKRPGIAFIDVDTPERTVSLFSNGEIQDALPETFFREKVSGDTRDDVNDPSSGVNYKNFFAKRALTSAGRENKDAFRSGSFVNPELGNAFAISPVNSSKDNEHYFGGHNKFINVKYYYLSGSAADNIDSYQEDFALTGSDSIVLSQSFYLGNDHLVVSGDARAGFNYEPSWFSGVFGGPASGSASDVSDPSFFVGLGHVFSFELSASNGSYDFDDFDIFVGGTPVISLKPFGLVERSVDDKQNHKYFLNYSVFGNNGIIPSPAARQAPAYTIQCSNASKTYVVKNMQMEFFLPLTDEGVRYFREDVENQTLRFGYVNPKILKDIE